MTRRPATPPILRLVTAARRMLPPALVRAGAWLRRTTTRRLPYFPDPDAVCPAHGARFCMACHANPGSCVSPGGQCSYWAATGMHWGACANRRRGR